MVVMAGAASAAVHDDLRDGDRYIESGDWIKSSAFDRAIAKAPGQVSAPAHGARGIFIIVKYY
jgi:hypothetical protein